MSDPIIKRVTPKTHAEPVKLPLKDTKAFDMSSSLGYPEKPIRQYRTRKQMAPELTDTKKAFIAAVEDYKIALKLNNHAICIDTGITEASMTHYMHGDRLPNAESLIKLADYFGCTVDYLLGRESI